MSIVVPLLLFIVLAAPAAFSQPAAPADSIQNARLQDYRAMYPRSPLCAADELTLWSCEAGARTYSLCSSAVVSRTSGYLQYRAAARGKTVFVYPPDKSPPLGRFQYYSAGNGDASLAFSNNGYAYTLIDPLRANSSIIVSKVGQADAAKEIACGGNQSLQINYTMRLMHDAGVWVGR